MDGKISVGKIKGSLLLHALRHSLLSASGRYFLQAGCPAKFIFMLLSFIDPPRACDAHCHFVISRTRLAIAAGLVSVGLFSCPEVCGRDSMKGSNEKLRSPSNHRFFFCCFLFFLCPADHTHDDLHGCFVLWSLLFQNHCTAFILLILQKGRGAGPKIAQLKCFSFLTHCGAAAPQCQCQMLLPS